MVAGNNFTDNFDADVNLSIKCREKMQGFFIFEETKESKLLPHYSKKNKIK